MLSYRNIYTPEFIYIARVTSQDSAIIINPRAREKKHTYFIFTDRGNALLLTTRACFLSV